MSRITSIPLIPSESRCDSKHQRDKEYNKRKRKSRKENTTENAAVCACHAEQEHTIIANMEAEASAHLFSRHELQQHQYNTRC